VLSILNYEARRKNLFNLIYMKNKNKIQFNVKFNSAALILQLITMAFSRKSFATFVKFFNMIDLDFSLDLNV